MRVAKLNGVCIRPVELRRLDTHTGAPNRSTSPAAPPSPQCALLRHGPRPAAGPVPGRLAPRPRTSSNPTAATRRTAVWVEFRGRRQARPRQGRRRGRHHRADDEADWAWTSEITRAGMRGNVLAGPAGQPLTARPGGARMPPTCPSGRSGHAPSARPSPPRTADVPAVDVRHAHLPSYGKCRQRRHPGRPGHLRLPRAARDALHFSKLVDRFVQNLRRVVGYDVQYFATVEPQSGSPRTCTSRSAAPCPAPRSPGPRRHLPPGVVALHR